jgi:uncharacterized membrane protein
MRLTRSVAVATALLLAAVVAQARPAGPPQAEVRAVLFFSPACPHCHEVMDLHLPPLLERFGAGLQIVSINAATPDGGRLYQDMVETFRLPRARLGVPALVVGDRVLVGSDEIPELLPALVLAGLAAGGVDWPDVGSIREALARAGLLQPAGVAAPFADVTQNAPPATARQRFMRDPAGNGAAVAVLIGLVLVLGWSVSVVRRGGAVPGRVPAWLIPTLVATGVAVAGYLSFIEVTGSTAVCGPVGDCNTVQQSPYAMLFGVLPVGVLGLAGYLVMGGAWLVWRGGPPRYRRVGAALLYGAALTGTAFSAYLTFLEPFVIGASCAWCLTSAAVIAVILMAATPLAARLRPPRRAPAT